MIVPVGATTLLLTVTLNVVVCGLVQPNRFTQLNVKVVVPVTFVLMRNAANVCEVMSVLIAPPVAAVEPSTPVMPLLAPVAVFAEPGVVVELNKQLVVTRKGPTPWQIDTEPDPPPATARLAGTPFTAVSEALFGRSLTVNVNDTAVLEQVLVLQITE